MILYNLALGQCFITHLWISPPGRIDMVEHYVRILEREAINFMVSRLAE